MHFEHHRSLENGRTAALSVSALVFGLALAAALDSTYWHPSAIGALYGLSIFAVLGITMPVIAWWLWRLYRGSGQWHLLITEHEVIWQVPQGIGEHGFRVLLSEIAQIVCASTRSAEGSDQYIIETKAGDSHRLNRSASGANLVKFSQTLQRLGVREQARYDD